MKLTDVKAKQPEAYKVFKFWHDRKLVKDSRHITVRDLYTFFDGCKIYVEVAPQYDINSFTIDPSKWYYTISNGIDFSQQVFDNVLYNNRREAELAAFYKAFELLEDNIPNKKIKVKK